MNWQSGSKRVLVINPIEAFLKESNDENYEEEMRQFQKEESGFVEKMKTAKVTKLNEIIEKPINAQMDEIDYFIQQGIILEGCIQLQLINPDEMKKMDIKRYQINVILIKRKRLLLFIVDKYGQSCLRPSISSYSRLYLLGKILNLKDEKFLTCYTKFFGKEFFSKDDEFQYKLQTLTNECEEVIWEIDPRAEVLNDLQKKSLREGKKILQSQEYVKVREKNGKAAENGKKIVKYYEQRLNMFARLQLEIQNKVQKLSG